MLYSLRFSIFIICRLIFLSSRHSLFSLSFYLQHTVCLLIFLSFLPVFFLSFFHLKHLYSYLLLFVTYKLLCIVICMLLLFFLTFFLLSFLYLGMYFYLSMFLFSFFSQSLYFSFICGSSYNSWLYLSIYHCFFLSLSSALSYCHLSPSF